MVVVYQTLGVPTENEVIQQAQPQISDKRYVTVKTYTVYSDCNTQ